MKEGLVPVLGGVTITYDLGSSYPSYAYQSAIILKRTQWTEAD